MSQTELQAILEQLIAHPAFRERIDVDPEGTIGGHDLTASEQTTLLSWDADRIEAVLGAPLSDAMRAVIAQLGPNTMSTSPAPAVAHQPLVELPRRRPTPADSHNGLG